jgi:hypothetical protein
MPTVSVRFTDDEARMVRRLRAERGCPTVSSLVRGSLGVEGPRPGAQRQPDSTETLTGLVVRLIERVEALERATLRGLSRADRCEVRRAQEPTDEPAVTNGLMTPTEAQAWGIAHPDTMPPGFERAVVLP